MFRRFSGASEARLASREPHLADAGRVERRLARLYTRLAGAEHAPVRKARWRTAAALTLSISETLERLATPGNPRHHPRPTRIRVCAFKKCDLDALGRNLVEWSRMNGDLSGHAGKALGELHEMEQRAILEPLLRISELTPVAALTDALEAVELRRRMLQELGAQVANQSDISAPPRRARRHKKAVSLPLQKAGKDEPGKANGKTVCLCGAVERLNRSRQCGTIRTEDGRSAFFSAKAVTGKLADLNEGDAVELTVRRGPLGLTAVRVECSPPQSG